MLLGKYRMLDHDFQDSILQALVAVIIEQDVNPEEFTASSIIQAVCEIGFSYEVVRHCLISHASPLSKEDTWYLDKPKMYHPRPPPPGCQQLYKEIKKHEKAHHRSD